MSADAFEAAKADLQRRIDADDALRGIFAATVLTSEEQPERRTLGIETVNAPRLAVVRRHAA